MELVPCEAASLDREEVDRETRDRLDDEADTLYDGSPSTTPRVSPDAATALSVDIRGRTRDEFGAEFAGNPLPHLSNPKGEQWPSNAPPRLSPVSLRRPSAGVPSSWSE